MSRYRSFFGWVRNLVVAGSRRFGRHRFNIALGYIAFVLSSIALALIGTRLLVEPSVSALAAQANADVGATLLWLRLNALAILLVMAAFGAVVLWLAVVRPVEQFRERMSLRVADSTPEEMATMAYWYERRSSQLQAVLADNEEHRRQLDEMEVHLRRRKASLESLVSMSGEALVLVDAETLITDMSPVACELSGWSKLAAVGKLFPTVFPCFDGSREHPREFPLQTLAQRVLEAASTLPRIENALLVNRQDQELRVLVTGAAVLGADNSAIGALFRIELLGHAGVAALGSGQIRTTTTNDPITGLMSRESFDRRIEELLNLARLNHVTHALLLVHHETLSTVSERFGFYAQEQVVWRSSEVLRDEVGDAGECYTISVDRSAILLPNRGEDAAAELAERLRKHIAAREFVWKDNRFACTISLAVVELTDAAEGQQYVMEAADQVLLQARRAGGNQVRRLTPDAALVAERLSDVQWVDWLAARLHNGRAHLISQVIQPVEAGGQRRPHIELYFRVEDDDGVWVSPGAFLPALERHNRTSLVDLWVVRALLDAVGDQLALMESHELFCINLCTGSLNERDFVPQLCELLGNSAVPPERICFEIEERTAASYANEVRRFVNEIRPLGVKIALDQCRSALGLEMLRDLPIDYVKIHEGLIKRAEDNEIDAARLEWVVRSAQLLQRVPVACGVEDTQVLTRLRRLGVVYAQGVAINKFGPIMT